MKSISVSARCLLLGVGISLAQAAQVSVVDISNTTAGCGQGFLALLAKGSCLYFPEGTLSITVTPDANESINALNEIDIVGVNGTDTYAYVPGEIDPSQMWQPKTIAAMESAGAASTLSRLSFETNSITRLVYLGDLYNWRGAEVYVAARASNSAQFEAQDVKLAYKVQKAAASSRK